MLAGRSLLYSCIYCLFFSTFTPAAQAQFAALVEVKHFCDGEEGYIEFALHGNASEYEYYWLHGPTTLAVFVTAPGTYTFVVRNLFGCEEMYEVDIYAMESCDYFVNSLQAPECETGIQIVVYTGNSTSPTILDEAFLEIKWSDDSNEGLIRYLPTDISEEYCVTITVPGLGGDCCMLDTCFNIIGQPCGGGTDGSTTRVIVNEYNRNSDGSGQYIELMVLGNGVCGDTFDLRGFYLDDNNGELIPGNNFVSQLNMGQIGIDPGFLSFSLHESWANVPNGSLIVIYENRDSLPAGFPSDDLEDGNQDGVYVLPVFSEGYLYGRKGSWNAISQTMEYSGSLYPLDWSLVNISPQNDGVQVRYPDGVYCHGVSYGSSIYSDVNDFDLWISEQPQNSLNCQLIGSDYLSKQDFVCPTADDGLQTPGQPNSAANQALRDSLLNCPEPAQASWQDGQMDMELPKQYNRERLELYPNPNSGHFTLTCYSDEVGQAQWQLHTLAGVLLQQERIYCEQGINNYPIKMNEAVPSGLYLIRFLFPSGNQQIERMVYMR